MNWVSVSSSHMAAVAYDPGESSLFVRFTDGGVYKYHNVPEHIHAGLMSASSHGSYLAARVKNVYRYTRL